FYCAGRLLGSVNTVTTSTVAGIYTLVGLPVGSYYVGRNTKQSRITQLYNGVVCVQCDVTTSGGTLVPVTANTVTPNINFALPAGGSIGGTITNAVGGAPIPNVRAQLFSSTGVPMGSFSSNASGVYTTSGLPPGTYYVRTGAAPNFIDKLWNNIPCPCTVTAGTPIVVTGTASVTGINFALSPAASTVVTTAATNITRSAAMLNGAVNPRGSSTTASFQYGLTIGYGSQVTPSPAPGSGTSFVAVSAAIAGLACNTLYHFRAVATNAGGPANGADAIFTTAACGRTITGDFDGDGKADLTVYR